MSSAQNPHMVKADAGLSPWEHKVYEVLRAEMARRGITYKDLTRRLESCGIDELPDGVNRKVNRKRFSAAFFLACLAAMGVESIDVPSQLKLAKAPKK